MIRQYYSNLVPATRYVDVNLLQTCYSLLVTLVRPTFGTSHWECNVAPALDPYSECLCVCLV
jgi:hypothetical protein